MASLRRSHTFGADTDRFKNSAYGRLDLKALIPGPGSYDEYTTSAAPSPSAKAHHHLRNKPSPEARPLERSFTPTILRTTSKDASGGGARRGQNFDDVLSRSGSFDLPPQQHASPINRLNKLRAKTAGAHPPTPNKDPRLILHRVNSADDR